MYRARARRYDLTAKLYYLVGFPQRRYRSRAVQALRLRPGDTVVEIACGTGLNFPLIEQQIGPDGRIIGVDLTDAMLDRARHRVRERGWTNVSLVQADARDFQFPARVDAILSTFALSLVPACEGVIYDGCAALSPGGRWVVLDSKPPDGAPRWLERGWLESVRPFAVTEELLTTRPWDAIRTAMQSTLVDFCWDELFFGFAFLATGARGGQNDTAR